MLRGLLPPIPVNAEGLAPYPDTKDSQVPFGVNFEGDDAVDSLNGSQLPPAGEDAFGEDQETDPTKPFISNFKRINGEWFELDEEGNPKARRTPSTDPAIEMAIQIAIDTGESQTLEFLSENECTETQDVYCVVTYSKLGEDGFMSSSVMKFVDKILDPEDEPETNTDSTLPIVPSGNGLSDLGDGEPTAADNPPRPPSEAPTPDTQDMRKTNIAEKAPTSSLPKTTEASEYTGTTTIASPGESAMGNSSSSSEDSSTPKPRVKNNSQNTRRLAKEQTDQKVIADDQPLPEPGLTPTPDGRAASDSQPANEIKNYPSSKARLKTSPRPAEEAPKKTTKGAEETAQPAVAETQSSPASIKVPSTETTTPESPVVATSTKEARVEMATEQLSSTLAADFTIPFIPEELNKPESKANNPIDDYSVVFEEECEQAPFVVVTTQSETPEALVSVAEPETQIVEEPTNNDINHIESAPVAIEEVAETTSEVPAETTVIMVEPTLRTPEVSQETPVVQPVELQKPIESNPLPVQESTEPEVFVSLRTTEQPVQQAIDKEQKPAPKPIEQTTIPVAVVKQEMTARAPIISSHETSEPVASSKPDIFRQDFASSMFSPAEKTTPTYYQPTSHIESQPYRPKLTRSRDTTPASVFDKILQAGRPQATAPISGSPIFDNQEDLTITFTPVTKRNPAKDYLKARVLA